MQNEISHIFFLIDKATNILLISHQKPDGDTLGAAIAMSLYMKGKRKNFSLFCEDFIPKSFLYLPLVQEYVHDIQDISSFDLIIALDIADVKRTGLSSVLKERKCIFVNIDHHYSNELYGDINLVKETSSTSELVYDMCKQEGKKITGDMATALLTGIMTDTDGFTNPATTQDAINAGSSLMRKGARFKQIMKHILKNKRVQDLQLWGKVLSTLHTNEIYNCVISIITLEDLMIYNVDEEATIGIANFLSLLSETNFVLVLQELPDGKIKGSFRTKKNYLDMSCLAKKFGGGGHKKAAGFTIKGRIFKQKGKWFIA